LTYILDACALMAFLAIEIGEGYEAVDALISRANTEDIAICISIINLVEVYYNFIYRYGTIEAADEIMRNMTELPISVIDTVSKAVYRDTARFKTSYAMSLADAFLCATAKDLSATIVTQDGEIRPAEQREKLSVLWIN
jgi:predicted nucleic acid-binding protein